MNEHRLLFNLSTYKYDLVYRYAPVYQCPPHMRSSVIVMLCMHRVWKNSPALKHIAIAKDNRNFQGCVTCIVLKSKKRSAARKGDKDAWTEADTELTYATLCCCEHMPCTA